MDNSCPSRASVFHVRDCCTEVLLHNLNHQQRLQDSCWRSEKVAKTVKWMIWGWFHDLGNPHLFPFPGVQKNLTSQDGLTREALDLWSESKWHHPPDDLQRRSDSRSARVIGDGKEVKKKALLMGCHRDTMIYIYIFIWYTFFINRYIYIYIYVYVYMYIYIMNCDIWIINHSCEKPFSTNYSISWDGTTVAFSNGSDVGKTLVFWCHLETATDPARGFQLGHIWLLQMAPNWGDD